MRIKLIIFTLCVTFLLLSFSYTQLAKAQNCNINTSTPRVNNGLVTTPNLDPNSKINISNPNYTGGDCIVNNTQATVPSYQLPTYASLKSQFYTQSKLAKSTSIPSSFSGDGLYNVQGPVNNTGYTFSGNGTEVFFIDGDLNITQNIIYHTSDFSGGLVFVTSGNININPTVTQIDGVLISSGVICSAYTGTNPCPAPSSVNDVQVANQLTINGSIISLNSSAPISLLRDLYSIGGGNSKPAENIITQPKYLVLLKNLFSQTLTIRSEDTNYAGSISH